MPSEPLGLRNEFRVRRYFRGLGPRLVALQLYAILLAREGSLARQGEGPEQTGPFALRGK